MCSSEPEIRRPPGPRNARSTDDTNPNETRAPPDGVAAAANTADPIVAPPADQAIGVVPAVSTDTTARSPSQSTPATVPRVARPSANRTVTSPPRRLWALVRTATVGDDDAGAAGAGPDADDGRGGGGRDGGDGLLELGEHGHGTRFLAGVAPRRRSNL